MWREFHLDDNKGYKIFIDFQTGKDEFYIQDQAQVDTGTNAHLIFIHFIPIAAASPGLTFHEYMKSGNEYCVPLFIVHLFIFYHRLPG